MKVNKNASQRVKGMKQNKRNAMHNQIDEENTDEESDQDSYICKLQMKKHGYIEKQKAIDASLINM